jgi:hypothetical protein
VPACRARLDLRHLWPSFVHQHRQTALLSRPNTVILTSKNPFPSLCTFFNSSFRKRGKSKPSVFCAGYLAKTADACTTATTPPPSAGGSTAGPQAVQGGGGGHEARQRPKLWQGQQR